MSAPEAVAATPHDPGLFLALAPMEGVTDAVFRALATDHAARHGGISQCVTEFVRVTSAPVPEHVLLRECPELGRGGRTPAGVPVFLQLLGGRPEPMAETAVLAAAMGAPGIDLNFGCPAKTVNRHDGGASLLREPARIAAVVGAVRERVPAVVPVTAKVRLGWSGPEHVEAIARAAASAGASWITVHARTRVQGYAPPVDWGAIDRARRAVDVPVVANGDLFTPEDLRRCALASGCRAFMIGRGAVARPHVFGWMRGLCGDDLDPASLFELLRDYAGRLIDDGATPGRVVGRLKQWLRLAAGVRAEMVDPFDRLKGERELPAVLAAMDRFALNAA